MSFRKTIHRSIRIFILISFITNQFLLHVRSENLQNNYDVECAVVTKLQIPELRGESHRTIVLLSGLNSSAVDNDNDDNNNLEIHKKAWHDFLVKVGHLFDSAIFFSYDEKLLYGYSANDTGRSIINHAVPLLRQRLEKCISNTPSLQSITLVGHSMGGVVINKYMQQYGFDLNVLAAQKVTHVLTLESPVNGSWWAYCTNIRKWILDKCTLDIIASSLLTFKGIPTSPDKIQQIREGLTTKVMPQLVNTDAGYELGAMYNDTENYTYSNLRSIESLEKRNSAPNFDQSYPVTFRFFVNKADLAVNPVDRRDWYIDKHTSTFTHVLHGVQEAFHSVIKQSYVLDGSTGDEIVDFLASSIPSLVPSIPAIDSPSGPPNLDNATFTGTESPADTFVAVPNQAIHKTWRVKNTGNRIWGLDYKLVFTGGNQMGAPNTVNIPVTVPGGTADISIDIRAPNTGGTYRGYWQLQNPEGTRFGPKISVQVTVPDSNNGQPNPDQSTMRLTCLDCPTTVAPGESFRPTVRVTGSVPLLGSRGDFLDNIDDKLYGAHPLVAVVGTVPQGGSYDFVFYEQNPFIAPTNEGIYESKWRVWQDGRYVGPELSIRFEVKANVNANHPPQAPTLIGPGDWAVYTGNGDIHLQAQAQGDPDGDAVSQYYFEIFESAQNANSGWISSNAWSPQGLGYNGYQWRVKVRDSRGAESGWSAQVWHFTVQTNEPQINAFYATQCHEPWGSTEQYCFCASTNAGTLRLQVNSATDGSDRGEWKVLNELGTTNYNCNNDNDRPPNWTHLEYATGTHLLRLYARRDGGWAAAANRDLTIYLPPERRPNAPHVLTPGNGTHVNSRTVTFAWQEALRTDNYRLQITIDPNWGTLLLDQSLAAGVLQYTYTFAEEYATVYWRVVATGPYGSNEARQEFYIDTTPPTSVVNSLATVTTDTKFTVNWSGSDGRVGLRWYHIQVRDGNRTDSRWLDWLVNTINTAELFIGEAGHTYYFRSRAMDTLGTWEEWPAGDGDSYTLVDPTAIPPTTWWNDRYASKRNLIILNNDGDTIPAQYPLHLRFDNSTSPTSAEIYNASLSAHKGDDLRIVYNNQTEVARYMTRFTQDAIDLWFPVQKSLAGGQSDGDSHQIYYGNDQAGNPPADPNVVFLPKTDANTMGLWHFYEGSGSTAHDSSGRSHHGTFNNAGWAIGPNGPAGSFNGSNAYVEIGHSDDFKPGAITLEAWIDLTGSTGDTRMIFNKDRYWFGITSGGELQFMIKADGGDRIITGSSHLSQNQWYHVAATYDGGQIMRLYLNGTLEREQSNGAPPVLWNSHPLRIGRSDNNATSYFPGYIQHARISNLDRGSFPYAFINIASSVAVGSLLVPPVPGSPDLTILSLNTYPNADGGVMVEALVQNQGTRETQNGFYTDLYIDHVPTGVGDYTGSAQFWVNSPIAGGATVTLTAVLTDFTHSLVNAASTLAAGTETTYQLYMQADSSGVVPDADKANNILSSGTEICYASPDSFEGDDAAAQATTLGLNQTQNHNFNSIGDQDWMKFSAEAGKDYLLSTGNLSDLADTYLYLYDTDGTTLLTANDDGNDTLASSIAWIAPRNGTYYLLVKQWNSNVSGCGTKYDLSIQNACPSPVAAPSAQIGDLDGDGDVDDDDHAILIAVFGQTGCPGWIAADLKQDGKIDIFDFSILNAHFGETINAPTPTSTPTPTPTPIESTSTPVTPKLENPVPGSEILEGQTVVLQWNRPANAIEFIVELFRNGGEFVDKRVNVQATSWDLGILPPAEYSVRIQALNSLGQWSEWGDYRFIVRSTIPGPTVTPHPSPTATPIPILPTPTITPPPGNSNNQHIYLPVVRR